MVFFWRVGPAREVGGGSEGGGCGKTTIAAPGRKTGAGRAHGRARCVAQVRFICSVRCGLVLLDFTAVIVARNDYGGLDKWFLYSVRRCGWERGSISHPASSLELLVAPL